MRSTLVGLSTGLNCFDLGLYVLMLNMTRWGWRASVCDGFLIRKCCGVPIRKSPNWVRRNVAAGDGSIFTFSPVSDNPGLWLVRNQENFDFILSPPIGRFPSQVSSTELVLVVRFPRICSVYIEGGERQHWGWGWGLRIETNCLERGRWNPISTAIIVSIGTPPVVTMSISTKLASGGGLGTRL